MTGAAQPGPELARVLLCSGRGPEMAARARQGLESIPQDRPFSSLPGRWQLRKSVFDLLTEFRVLAVWWHRIAQEKTLADQSESQNTGWFG